MMWVAKQGALRIAVMCLLGCVLMPAVTFAQAMLFAGRDGGLIQIHVTAYWNEMPAEWTGLVVQRWTDGVCDDATTVTPAPWPREVPPPQYPGSDYSLSDPVPAENCCYGYAVRAVDAEGQLHFVNGAGEQAFDYVSCGNAIVARGHLVLDYQHPLAPPLFVACAEGCWERGADFVNLDLVDPATYMPFVYSGVPVDIYGEIEVSDLLPNVLIVASQIVATPSGQCGPIPVQPMSWGQAKTIYR